MARTQPGSGDNDIVALALLLISLAILVNTRLDDRAKEAPWPALAVAGAAAGLAMGVKFSMVVPVVLLALGVLAILPDRRLRLSWSVPFAAAGSLWFVRNLVAFGNPVPAVHVGIGPVALHAVRLPTSSTVADLSSNPGAYRHIFLPGLHWAFGPLWPVLLAVGIVGIVAGIVYGRSRLDRVLAVVAALSAVTYVFTPRTADGFGTFFRSNLRYLMPALLIGLILAIRIPVVTALLCRPYGLILPVIGLVLVLIHGPSFGATSVLVAAGLAVTATCGLLMRGRIRAWGVVAICGLAALALLAWPAERTYLRTRYASGGPFSCELIRCAPLSFIQSLHRARVALGGSLGPYLLYGRDLSNRVVNIGRRVGGNWSPIQSCRSWRQALASGDYDYVVTSPPLYLYVNVPTPQASWTRTDPAATELSSTSGLFGATVTVFKLHGRPNPAGCGSIGGVVRHGEGSAQPGTATTPLIPSNSRKKAVFTP
jgi:tryptophan-rich sensory protein